MASRIAQQMEFVVDINSGLVVSPQRPVLMKNDKNANVAVVQIVRGKEKYSVAGATATGKFLRPPNKAAVPLTGTVTENRIEILLTDHCYTAEGPYELDIMLTMDGATRTILAVTGTVYTGGSGAYVDVSGVIPNLDDIIAQYATMQQVTEDTVAAKNAANTAASNANSKASAANTAAGNANTAASNANAAAAKIDGMTVSASESTTAGATISEKNGVKHIAFVLPKGETGATPDITFEAVTGEPGTDVELEQSGTPEKPVIRLTIPRGDTGAIEGIDYYTGSPKALGTASPGTANGVARGDHVHPMPNADQVGALAKAAQAADSALLAGKTAGYYIQPYNLLDNSDFTQPVNQNGKTSYTTASGVTIDRWVMSKGQVSVSADGITLTANDGSCVLMQFIPDLPDGDYCFAVHAAGQIGYRNFTLAGGTITSISSSGYTGGYLQVIRSSSTSPVQFSIRAESGYTVALKWAALYKGTYTADTLPPYTARGYAAEVLACKRYRLVYPTIGTYAVAFATGIVQTATTARFSIDLPVEIRLAAPSISVEGVTWGVYTAGQNITPTEVTVLKAAGNKLYLQATASGMTPGETACLVFKASSDAGGLVYVDASA
ncbi:MAG: hypothetical protein J6K32_12970 [Clostridia bacterium]|nr:hypothetical protein [Clostridia bacterium]